MDEPILHFLASSELGEIKIGVSYDDVIELLGEPDYQDGDCDAVNYIKYGSMEVVFDLHKHVNMINLVCYEGEFDFPEKLFSKKGNNTFLQGKSLEAIAELLNENDIGFRIFEQFTEDECVCLITEANVMIFYGLLYSGLDKIQVCSGDRYVYDIYK